MDKFGAAYNKLSPAAKKQMDVEYQSNKNAGNTSFKSSITGYKYSIPENLAKSGTAPVKGATDLTSLPSYPVMKFASNRSAISKPAIAPSTNTKESDRLKELSNIYKSGKTSEEMGQIADARKTGSASMTTGKEKPTSYVGTLNNIMGSTAAARVGSQLINKTLDPLLQSVDKVAGTKLADREVLGQDMDESGLGGKAKSLLYKAANNKAKSTGKNSGSITYEDFKDVLPGADYKAMMDSKAFKVGKMKQGLLAATSAGVDLGLTVGGANWKKDPKTGEINITDSYDFINDANQNKDGSLKDNWYDKSKKNDEEKTGLAFHDKLTKYDLDIAKRMGLKNRKFDFKLTPQDTLGRSASDKKPSLVAKLLYGSKKPSNK